MATPSRRFAPTQRVRIADHYPNIRWAGMYGNIDGYLQHGEGWRYRLVLEEGSHMPVVEEQYLTPAPTLEEWERMTGTVTGRVPSRVPQTSNVPTVGERIAAVERYVQKHGDVLILGDNGQPLGCVDAQVPLGECRVKVMINGEARWYRMVEAVSREAEEAAAKVGVFTPGRKLKL